ncbi:MAG: AtpZ/AtpI family protein [Bythopirellula sp.]
MGGPDVILTQMIRRRVPSHSQQNLGSQNQPDHSRKMNRPDDRSAPAKAAAWVSRIITISIEMVVPGLLGYWLDGKLGTKFVFMLAGFVFGVTFAIKHLLKLTQQKN